MKKTSCCSAPPSPLVVTAVLGPPVRGVRGDHLSPRQKITRPWDPPEAVSGEISEIDFEVGATSPDLPRRPRTPPSPSGPTLRTPRSAAESLTVVLSRFLGRKSSDLRFPPRAFPEKSPARRPRRLKVALQRQIRRPRKRQSPEFASFSKSSAGLRSHPSRRPIDVKLRGGLGRVPSIPFHAFPRPKVPRVALLGPKSARPGPGVTSADRLGLRRACTDRLRVGLYVRARGRPFVRRLDRYDRTVRLRAPGRRKEPKFDFFEKASTPLSFWRPWGLPGTTDERGTGAYAEGRGRAFLWHLDRYDRARR